MLPESRGGAVWGSGNLRRPRAGYSESHEGPTPTQTTGRPLGTARLARREENQASIPTGFSRWVTIASSSCAPSAPSITR